MMTANSNRNAAPRRGAAALHLLAFLLLSLAWAAPAAGHGLEVTSDRGPAALVQGEYDDGEPMSFVKVKITGPDGKTFQVGHSDAKGRFAWLPDRDGDWTAVMTDGMGHRGQAVLDWRALPTPQITPAAPQPAGEGLEDAPRWARAVWGLSLIWFVAGGLFWLRGRRLRREISRQDGESVRMTGD